MSIASTMGRFEAVIEDPDETLGILHGRVTSMRSVDTPGLVNFAVAKLCEGRLRFVKRRDLPLCQICTLGFVLCLATAGGQCVAAALETRIHPGQAEVPYPEALEAAAVCIRKSGKNVSLDIRSEGLVVGNGETNAIVYAIGHDLMLRVSKNDVWDGRIDTSEDPEIPKVDPSTHTLFRERPGNPPSWNKPYPCAVPCADVKLLAGASATGWTAELDLARAVVTATASDRTTVRALANANVFFITSTRPAELVGIPQEFLPAATRGTAPEGIDWLCQTIPGDEDARGMEVYLATAAVGPRRAVAVVTSSDAAAPLEQAIRLVRETLSRPEEDLIGEREAAWMEIWSRSGVRLSDQRLQNWWYRMVYYVRCFAREGATGVGLKASFDGLAGWHNSYKFNYNIQQTYCAAGPINHPELSEPLIDVLQSYWPRARWFARNAFVGCEGAFVHSDVFHPCEPDPAQCKSKNRHQLAYIPWGYSLGMQGHIAFTLWESHQYRPDNSRLREKLYPMLRDIALFYCSFIEKCAKDEAGKYVIGPSYIPENHYFGQDNTAYDLPFIAYGLRAAREAAGIMRTDEALARRIDAILERMPDYPQWTDPSQEGKTIVTYYRGAKLPDDDRHASLVMAVFPAGQVHWFSPFEEKELFRRSIDLVGRITTHANSPVTLNIARARLGMTEEALTNMAVDFTQHHKELPNGLFFWKGHGTYISEQVGVSRLIAELLLQSVGDVIRVFPAWPMDKDAEFTRLRAQGGLLVSARLVNAEVLPVAIEATVDGHVSLANPWPNKSVSVISNGTTKRLAAAEVNGIIDFPVEAGGSYRIAPE